MKTKFLEKLRPVFVNGFAFVVALALGHQALARAADARLDHHYLKMDNGRRLWIEHHKASNGAPTLVVLNGLTYSTRQWDKFVASVHAQDPEMGILRYDMRGMGNTLVAEGYPFEVIPDFEQVEDLRRLIEQTQIQGPRYIVGLSYGGGIGVQAAAKYPDLADGFILQNPFLRVLPDQDAWIRSNVEMAKNWAKFNPLLYWAYGRATYEELYDYFLTFLVFGLYPAAEPAMLKHPWRSSGVYQMVRGIRNFHINQIIHRLPKRKIHLMVSRADEYVPQDIFDSFWEQMSEAARASRLLAVDARHKLPEEYPSFTAAWVIRIARDPEHNMKQGLTFESNPWSLDSPAPARPLGCAGAF